MILYFKFTSFMKLYISMFTLKYSKIIKCKSLQNKDILLFYVIKLKNLSAFINQEIFINFKL